MLAVLVLSSLVLLTVDYRQGEAGAIAALQRTALSMVAPLQEGVAAVTRPIANFTGSLAELGRLRSENAALEAELQRLREGRISQADLARENAALREQLAMRQRLGYTTTGAHVIAQPPGAFGWTVLIDAGHAHGIRPGMAVLNAAGLVGKVTEVTSENARVQLLTSPNSGYAVRVVDSGEEGLLTGRGPRPFQLEVINPEAEVPALAEVVTRSFRGSSIPDGVPIGVVEETPETGGTGGRFLAVRPYVDFTRLNLVQVILDAPSYPEDLAPEDTIDTGEPPRPPPPPSPTAEPVPEATATETETEGASAGATEGTETPSGDG